MKKFIAALSLLTASLVGTGAGQAIYNQNQPPFVSCNLTTTATPCQYAALPLFNGYTLPSSFSWETIYTGGPSGTTVNLEGSVDGRTTLDVVTAASSTTITSATMKFTQADVGKTIYIGGAASGGATQVTTIASVTNATTAVLTASATLAMTAAPALVASFYQLDQTTNTSGEFRSVVNKPVKFVRCNVTTLTGGTSPTVYCAFVAKGA